MNGETPQVVRVVVWALMVCTAPSVAMADYAIASYTIEPDATTSSGGGFVLTGVIEPSDANVPAMTGGPFSLAGELGLSLPDTDGEAANVSECGRGVEEALPLLMIGLAGLYAVTRRRT